MSYNSTMTIVVTGTNKAADAVRWCEKNIGISGWVLRADIDIFSSKYHFQFDNQQDATHFALKWR